VDKAVFLVAIHDGLHPEFPFEQVFSDLDGSRPGDSVEWADMVAGLAIILDWICLNRVNDVRQVAARALTLHYLLSPEMAHYKSLAEIADACGTTKQCVSRKPSIRISMESTLRFISSGVCLLFLFNLRLTIVQFFRF
jgi:hypothetical protein